MIVRLGLPLAFAALVAVGCSGGSASDPEPKPLKGTVETSVAPASAAPDAGMGTSGAPGGDGK